MEMENTLILIIKAFIEVFGTKEIYKEMESLFNQEVLLIKWSGMAIVFL